MDGDTSRHVLRSPHSGPGPRHPRRSPHHASADRRSAPPFTWSLQGPRTAERIGAFGVELDACHPRSAPATETQGQGAEGQAQGPRETDCAGVGGRAGWGEAGHGRPRPARPYPDPSPGPACTAEHLSGVVPGPGPCPTAPHPQAHLPPSHSRQVAWVLSAAHRLLVRLELEPVPVQECAHLSVHACV